MCFLFSSLPEKGVYRVVGYRSEIARLRGPSILSTKVFYRVGISNTLRLRKKETCKPCALPLQPRIKHTHQAVHGSTLRNATSSGSLKLAQNILFLGATSLTSQMEKSGVLGVIS